MAGAGKKTFTAGETLTASDVNTYLMEQSVMVFGGTAARSSAIPTPTTGMTSYIGVTGTATIPQIETYTGSAWQTPYGITLLSKVDVTAATTVTFTGVFSADYDNYLLTYNGKAASAGSGFLRITFGAATTGYYFNLFDGRSGAGSVAVQLQASNTSSLSFSPNWDLGTSCQTWIGNPFRTQATTVSSQFAAMDSAPVSTSGNAGGALNNTTSYTACTVTPSTSTMTGTFRIYGLRNS